MPRVLTWLRSPAAAEAAAAEAAAAVAAAEEAAATHLSRRRGRERAAPAPRDPQLALLEVFQNVQLYLVLEPVGAEPLRRGNHLARASASL